MDINSQKLESFFASSNALTYPKGKTILNSDQKVGKVFYLKKGLVRQFTISPEGEELTVNIFKPGSIFPLMITMAEASNHYEFVCESNTILYPKAANEVLEFLKDNTEYLFDLCVRFAKGLANLSLRLEHQSFENAYTKTISILLFLADRYGKKTKAGVLIDLPLTHNQLSSWIGIKRETLSRQVQKLTSKGLIGYSHQEVVIKDVGKLKKEDIGNSNLSVEV